MNQFDDKLFKNNKYFCFVEVNQEDNSKNVENSQNINKMYRNQS